eukprot:scaffold18062_cov60-Phaeocystis_antarctica.AAC.2
MQGVRFGGGSARSGICREPKDMPPAAAPAAGAARVGLAAAPAAGAAGSALGAVGTSPRSNRTSRMPARCLPGCLSEVPQESSP